MVKLQKRGKSISTSTCTAFVPSPDLNELGHRHRFVGLFADNTSSYHSDRLPSELVAGRW